MAYCRRTFERSRSAQRIRQSRTSVVHRDEQFIKYRICATSAKHDAGQAHAHPYGGENSQVAEWNTRSVPRRETRARCVHLAEESTLLWRARNVFAELRGGRNLLAHLYRRVSV